MFLLSDKIRTGKNYLWNLKAESLLSLFVAVFVSAIFEAFFQAVTMREVVYRGVTFFLPTNRLETINPFIKIH